jgi:hypothetical protein
VARLAPVIGSRLVPGPATPPPSVFAIRHDGFPSGSAPSPPAGDGLFAVARPDAATSPDPPRCAGQSMRFSAREAPKEEGRGEGKIEGRTSPKVVGACLHIGWGGATARAGCAALARRPLNELAETRRSPAALRPSVHDRRPRAGPVPWASEPWRAAPPIFRSTM